MKLDHVALIVSDLETSIDFYTRFLSLEIKREFELSEEESQSLFQVTSPARAVQLLMQDGMLELFEFKRGIEINIPTPLTNGLFHYALQIGRPIEAFITKARERDIPIYSIVRGGKTIYFIQDPDGVFIEVKE
ncbi:MAG: VOC family protein [Deltaproteobacteria bacterium]|nr:VOC family protein [Deltaproteobacteria bacterium]